MIAEAAFPSEDEDPGTIPRLEQLNNDRDSNEEAEPSGRIVGDEVPEARLPPERRLLEGFPMTFDVVVLS